MHLGRSATRVGKVEKGGERWWEKGTFMKCEFSVVVLSVSGLSLTVKKM